MPSRLNQSYRGRWGVVVQPYMNKSNVQKPINTGRKDVAQKNIFLQNGQMGTGMQGEGIMEAISQIIDKGKKVSAIAGRVSDIATGETATALRNLLPSSDINARPGFAGEKHAILKLPNGKYGVANYMGPGTKLVKRLRRGDPPRTLSDKVAQTHDIRYGLAKNQKDVSKADRKMIAKLKEIQRKRLDSRFNTQLGMRPIQAKMRAESLGIVKPGRIASFGDIASGDQSLVSSKLKELEQEGFGLPGDMLRKKLVQQMKRKKTKQKARKTMKKRRKTGAGLKLAGQGGTRKHSRVGTRGQGLALAGNGNGDAKELAKHLAKCVSSKLLPTLLKKLGLASMSGSGRKKLDSLLHMRLLKAMNDGASRNKKDVMKGSGKKLKALKKGAIAVSKTLLPILIKLAMKKMAGSGTHCGRGSGAMSFAELKRKHLNPSMFDKLSRKLAEGAFAFLKRALVGRGMSGDGMCGAGFWSSFKKGFMSVVGPALKIAKTVAPIVPLLL